MLNYSPGPVLTDMVTRDIQGDPDTDPAIREWSLKTLAEEKYLQPGQTARRLLAVLREDGFDSGDHVDYFDEISTKT